MIRFPSTALALIEMLCAGGRPVAPFIFAATTPALPAGDWAIPHAPQQ
jgi:hypothetical protein